MSGLLRSSIERRPRDPLLALAACTLLTLVASACGPVSPPSTAGATVITPVPTATPVAATTAIPSASPRSSSTVGWQRSPDQAALANALLRDAIWTGSRFLVIDDQGEVLLESADGLTWQREPALPSSGSSGPPGLVAAGPAGVIAIAGGGDAPTGLWRSADGLAWSGFDVEKAFRARDHAFGGLSDVVGTDQGWLAVGGEEYMNAPTQNLLRATVFTSPDGIDWTRVRDSAERAHGEMTSVVRTPSGYTAVGAVVADPSRGDSGLRAAVWTSPDGRAWSSSTEAPTFDMTSLDAGKGPTDVVLHAIAAQGSRLVVLGEVTRYEAATDAAAKTLAVAWWSDGEAGPWTPVVIDQDRGPGSMTISAVPGGFLTTLGIGSGCSSKAWGSADGSTWTCIDDPAFAGFAVTGAASSPSAELLVGYNAAEPDATGTTTWTRAAP